MPENSPLTELHDQAMGTNIHLLVTGESLSADLLPEAREFIEKLEAKWSRFRPTSELCRLNANPNVPVIVSPDTFTIIEQSIEAWRETKGFFDPTILAALEDLGYVDDFRTHIPSNESSGSPGIPIPTPEHIELNKTVQSVCIPNGVTLDLGGIGKGYAADLTAEWLIANGAAGACVNLGGDIRMIGEPPTPSGWIIELEGPPEKDELGIVRIEQGAVATSTTWKRSWTRANEPVHHLIDPRTGTSSTSAVVLATVIADTAWWAEVLAKAALIAGFRVGSALITEHDATGLLLSFIGEITELPKFADFR